MSKVKKLNATGLPPLHEVYEVHWNGQPAHGLVLADVQNSWVFSIEPSHNHWSQPSIPATRHGLEEVSAELVVTECKIQNLANTAHCIHWETSIRDWGASVALSCVLDSINGHNIVMYPGPREHNPPHVHVLHKGSSSTLAKYRIEDCALEDGKPTLNSEMRIWLTQYRDQLLISWERCQRGGTPYRLELP
ncbi:MAG: DUF4160 domain-containing protein [Rhodoferax sp.]|nr:DUF4160 domain-containing protein [Rhodoferax sp.]